MQSDNRSNDSSTQLHRTVVYPARSPFNFIRLDVSIIGQRQYLFPSHLEPHRFDHARAQADFNLVFAVSREFPNRIDWIARFQARSHPTYLITVTAASLAPTSPDFQPSSPFRHPFRALCAPKRTRTRRSDACKRRIRIVGRPLNDLVGAWRVNCEREPSSCACGD